MIDPKEVLKSLKTYKKEEFKTTFLDEAISYFESLNKPILQINENEYQLAGIRLYVMYNNCYVYLAQNPVSERACRELKLSKNQAFNLINQIDGVLKNSFIICDKIPSETTKLFVIVSHNKIKGYDKYLMPEDMYGVLFGINSLYFLEHQNLENYCNENIIKMATELYGNLTEYRKKLKALKWQDRDRIMIHSGLIFQFLGTVYSSDVDIIFVGKGIQDTQLLEDIKTSCKMADVANINVGSFKLAYKYDWFVYKLPQLGGAEDIYTMLINPKFHFFFMGLKCMDITATIGRTVSRSHPFSFVDLYLLKTINKIEYPENACIKNITIRQGESRIINNKDLIHFYKTIQKYLKEWYNIDLDLKYIKEHFIKCDKKFGTIYKNIITRADPLMKKQSKLHRSISQIFIRKYGTGAQYLLDIGSGALFGAYIYQQIGVKNVYGIEPSIYSIEQAKKKALEYSTVNFNLIQGYGDKPFDLGKKFDIITLTFTIHYMIDSVDILLENIKKHSKSNTKIVVSCVNGDKVFSKLKHLQKYEIRYNNDICWGVYRYNDPIEISQKTPKVLFYMKDVYGLENGSEEPIVLISDLILEFEKKGFKLIVSKSFLDIYNEGKPEKLLDFQKQILNMQQALVFNTT